MHLCKKVLAIFALCSLGHQALGQNDESVEALINLVKSQPRMFEKEIQGAVDCVKQLIRDGIFGLSLDPFNFPWLPVVLDTEMLRSKLFLANISFEGLSDFEADPATVKLAGFLPPKGALDLGLTFNGIKFETNYDGSLKVMQFLNMFGKGKFRFGLEKLKINLDVHVDVMPLKLTKVNITLGLPSTDWEVTGLYNDENLSKIITHQLKDTVNSLATDYEGALNTLINDTVEGFIGIINTFLEGMSIQDIINMITGGGKGGNGARGILDCKKASAEVLQIVNATYGATLRNYFKLLQETY